MKRWISFALAFVMILTLVPTDVLAEIADGYVGYDLTEVGQEDEVLSAGELEELPGMLDAFELSDDTADNDGGAPVDDGDAVAIGGDDDAPVEEEPLIIADSDDADTGDGEETDGGETDAAGEEETDGDETDADGEEELEEEPVDADDVNGGETESDALNADETDKEETEADASDVDDAPKDETEVDSAVADDVIDADQNEADGYPEEAGDDAEPTDDEITAMFASGEAIPGRGIYPNKTEITLYMDDGPFELHADVYDGERLERQDIVVTWTVVDDGEDPHVALDAENGVLTALAVGSATVTASAEGYETIDIPVTVKPRREIRLSEELPRGVLGVGDKLTAAVYCEGEDDPTEDAGIVWTSDKPKITSIDRATGVLTAKAAGTATITATVDGRKPLTVDITVKSAPKSVTVKLDIASLVIGEQAQASCQFNSGAESRTVTYDSSDETVATVDPTTGLITAVGKGTAAITARASCNGKTGKATVRVYGTPDHIELRDCGNTDHKDFDLPVLVAHDEAVQVVATLVDAEGEATLGALSWSVSEDETAAPDDVPVISVTQVRMSETPCVLTLSIRGNKNGNASVTFANDDNAILDATCAVHVVDPPKSLRFNRGSITIGVKESYGGAVVEMTPNDGGSEETSATVTFRSANTKYVKVTKVDNRHCVITGVKATKKKIKITASHQGKIATIYVTVKKAPSKVYVRPSSIRMIEGDSAVLTASTNSVSNSYTFTSSDASGLEAGDAGTADQCSLTAHRKGDRKVAVKAYNGKKATATVTVYGAPVNIEAQATSLHLIEGQKNIAAPITVVDADGNTVPIQLLNDHVDAPRFVADITGDAPDCVSVDPNTGAITALKKGTAVITYGCRVKDEDAEDGYRVASQAVSVEIAPAPKALEFSRGSFTMGLGEVYGDLSCLLVPKEEGDAPEAKLYWTSSKSSVVRVVSSSGENGEHVVLQAKKTGKAKITVRDRVNASLKKTVTVTVSKKPKKVTAYISPSTISVGMERKIRASVGKGTGSAGYTYLIDSVSSEDPDCISVDENGVITAIKPGSAFVWVHTYLTKIKTKIKVTVLPAPASITSVPATFDIIEGLSATLDHAVLDANGDPTVADYTFVSSDPECVAVDVQTGAITALKKGRATITVTTQDPDCPAVTCAVRVYGRINRFETNIPETLRAGSSLQLRVTKVFDSDGDAIPQTAYTPVFKASTGYATVDADARLTGVSAGRVTITISLYWNGKRIPDCLDSLYQLVVTQKLRVFAAYGYYSPSKSGYLRFPKNNATGVFDVFDHLETDTCGLQYVKSESKIKNVSKKADVTGLLDVASGAAGENDLTIVYLCSHGKYEGSQYRMYYPGYDKYSPSTYITDQEILNGVKKIKGKVVLVIDSCYSGVFITHMKSQLSELYGKVAVLTAAKKTRACYYTGSEENGACDFFTHSLLQGIGYKIRIENGDHNRYVGGMPADSGKTRNGMVTLSEFFNYGNTWTKKYVKKYKGKSVLHGDPKQKPQYYANGLGSLVLFGS